MKNDQSNEQSEGRDQLKRCIERLREVSVQGYMFMIDNSHANVAEKKTISYRNNFIDTLYDVST